MKYIILTLLLMGCSNADYGTSTNYKDKSLESQIIGKWCTFDYIDNGNCLIFEIAYYSRMYNDSVLEKTTYYVSSNSIFIKDHFVLNAEINNDTLTIEYFNNKNVRYKKVFNFY